jgi:hypothetical protein
MGQKSHPRRGCAGAVFCPPAIFNPRKAHGRTRSWGATRQLDLLRPRVSPPARLSYRLGLPAAWPHMACIDECRTADALPEAIAGIFAILAAASVNWQMILGSAGLAVRSGPRRMGRSADAFSPSDSEKERSRSSVERPPWPDGLLTPRLRRQDPARDRTRAARGRLCS